MNFLDIAPSICAFIVALYALPSIKDGIKPKHYIVGAILLLTTGFAIYQASQNSDSSNTMSQNISDLKEARKVDSISNSNFQQYLKDSLGVEKIGDKVTIVNKNVYNSFNETIRALKQVVSDGILPDSTNYKLTISRDTFFFAPKQGTWSRAVVLWDSSMHPDLDMGVSNISKRKIMIENKIQILDYNLSNTEVVSKDEPFRIMINKEKVKFLIFGDDVNRNKRYLYKNSKVRWFPEQ